MAKNKHNAKVGSTVERSDDRIKSTGEVFTPMELVYEMIDEISDEIMQDKTKTFLDNSCGSGNFLFGLYTRLTEKYGHTHEEAINRLYGVDFMEDNIKETRRRLGVPDTHCHFVWADALAYDYSFNAPTWAPSQTNDLETFFG